MIKPNQFHHFDLLYMLHDDFEGNIYKYILEIVDVASRYNVGRALKSKKTIEVTFCWKRYIRCVASLNTKRYFLVIMGDMIKLLDCSNSKKSHSQNSC